MTDLNSIPDADKATYWQNHLNQWQSSGLTQKDYCREQHLSHRQFLYWRSREKLSQQRIPPLLRVVHTQSMKG